MPNSLTDAILDFLLSAGPTTDFEIHSHLVATGQTKAKTATGVRSALGSSPLAYRLEDGRWDTTARRLLGSVFTVRPRSKLREGVLWVHQDLDPLEAVGIRDGIPLATGGRVRRGGTEIRTLIGPPGWLPTIKPGELLALRWSDKGLHVSPLAMVPEIDDPVVRRARLLLRAHSLVLAKSNSWPEPPVGRWGRVVLSALAEDPELFAHPLPPLSELLPLPELVLHDPSVWEAHGDSRRLTLHLPPRVYDELDRRAGLLGDRLVDFAAMMLGAAIDRLQPDTDNYRYYDQPSYTRYDRYDEERYGVPFGEWDE